MLQNRCTSVKRLKLWVWVHLLKKVTPNLKSWFYFFLVWLNDIQPYFFKQNFEFLNSRSVLDTHITFKWAKKQANLSPFYASPLWNMVCCRSNADLDGIYFESRLLDSNFYRKRLWKFALNIYFSQVVEFWRKKKSNRDN